MRHRWAPKVRPMVQAVKYLIRDIYMETFYAPTMLAVREHEPGETAEV